MRRLPLVLFITCLLLVPIASLGQSSEPNRKVVNRVIPLYPSVARSMRLGGTVRVEAWVASNGTVKNVSCRGGSPLLATAAADAVRKWKWASANRDSHEEVELKFDPDH